jgi:hypothetical protein
MSENQIVDSSFTAIIDAKPWKQALEISAQ